VGYYLDPGPKDDEGDDDVGSEDGDFAFGSKYKDSTTNEASRSLPYRRDYDELIALLIVQLPNLTTLCVAIPDDSLLVQALVETAVQNRRPVLSYLDTVEICHDRCASLIMLLECAY